MTKKIHNRGTILTPVATRLQLQPAFDAPIPWAGFAIRFAMMMRSLSKIPRRHLCLFLCLLGTAFAGVGGSISGTVKDPTGAAIAQASVTLVNGGTGVRQSAAADGRGVYTFPVLPVGRYVLEVN